MDSLPRHLAVGGLPVAVGEFAQGGRNVSEGTDPRPGGADEAGDEPQIGKVLARSRGRADADGLFRLAMIQESEDPALQPEGRISESEGRAVVSAAPQAGTRPLR